MRELLGIVRAQPQHRPRGCRDPCTNRNRSWHQYSYHFGAVLRRHEELHLHLLELTGAEDEVARGDLVAERLADLRDAERRLLAGRGLHVLEVDEDALGRLGAQVRDRGVVLHRADVGLEHQVEVAGLGEGVLGPAVRARTRLGELVGPEPLLAVAAVDERVGERGDVAARLPDLGRHEDRRVEADDVVAQLHHRPPPGVLDVALEQHAERPVIPRRTEPAVDLGRGKDQSASFREIDDAVHQVGAGHGRTG